MNSTWYPEIEEPIKSREKHYSLVLYILKVFITKFSHAKHSVIYNGLANGAFRDPARILQAYISRLNICFSCASPISIHYPVSSWCKLQTLPTDRVERPWKYVIHIFKSWGEKSPEPRSDVYGQLWLLWKQAESNFNCEINKPPALAFSQSHSRQPIVCLYRVKNSRVDVFHYLMLSSWRVIHLPFVIRAGGRNCGEGIQTSPLKRG